MPDPTRALDSAVAVVSSRGKQTLPQFVLFRLSQIGYAAGKPVQAQELANAIADEGLKAWVHGDGIHQRVLSNPKEKAEENWSEVPKLADKLRAGCLGTVLARTAKREALG
jgi:hypothetical protein